MLKGSVLLELLSYHSAAVTCGEGGGHSQASQTKSVPAVRTCGGWCSSGTWKWWLSLAPRTHHTIPGMSLAARTYYRMLWLSLVPRTHHTIPGMSLAARTYYRMLWLSLVPRTHHTIPRQSLAARTHCTMPRLLLAPTTYHAMLHMSLATRSYHTPLSVVCISSISSPNSSNGNTSTPDMVIICC